ncbi:MAG: hypothetical protein E7309_04935 [Butyrivibrio sp.]|nr:hypothetical protein [Butyrivibrio sp.]
MLILLQKIVVPLIAVIIPPMFKTVFINETVLEYALYTRKEKEQKRLYNDIVVNILLFGMILLVRFCLLLEVIVVSKNIAQLIAGLCCIFFLARTFISGIICLVRNKNEKEGDKDYSEEKSKKKSSFIQFLSLYSFVLPVTGLTFSFYQSEIHPMEVAFYMYVAIVVTYIIRVFVFSSYGIDKAIVYYEKKEFSNISGKEELKKVYIYHKVENDYLLCGDTIEMNKPNQVIEINEFLKNKFYYID